jgi:signal peptidase I
MNEQNSGSPLKPEGRDANAVPSPPPRTDPWWMRAIFGRNPKVTLIRLVITISLVVILFRYVLVPIEVVGTSMEPTYYEGKRNLVNRLVYFGTKPQRGDVVAIRTKGQNYMLLKRIVGLPGERVRYIQGYVFINGKLLNEPYVRFRGWQYDDVTLDEDFYYLIGDNRNISAFGKRHVRQIIGKVVF